MYHDDTLPATCRTGAEAIDEEADRDDGETDRELAGDRQVAAALAQLRVGPREYRRQDHDPDRIERLVLARRPDHAEQAEALVPLDIAQCKQRQRGRHLLVEDEEQQRLDDQDQRSDQSGALVLRAGRDHVAENAQGHDAGDVDAGDRDLGGAGSRTRPRTAARSRRRAPSPADPSAPVSRPAGEPMPRSVRTIIT
jgi:hypothetical protein